MTLLGKKEDFKALEWLSRPDFVSAIIKSIRHDLKCCITEGIDCRDPPAITTSLLYSMGHGQYFVRSFWGKIPPELTRVPIYKHRSSSFYLEFYHDIGTVYEIECDGWITPLDRLDADKMNAIHTPNSHRLFIRISGYVENNSISVNLLRLLYLLEIADRGSVWSFLDLLHKVLENPNKGREELYASITGLVGRWDRVLRIILPKVPGDIDEVRKLSPLVRWVGL